jgi:outer membrane protein TolC
MIKVVLMFLVLVATSVCAGPLLTLEDAIALGLKNNYDIQIARNQARVAANNKGLGLAGFLPTLDASAGYNLTDREQDVDTSAGVAESDIDDLNAEVRLNWTIFDGFGMFINRARYNELAELGDLQARNQIENSIVAISRAYFDLVRQEQLLEVGNEVVEVSRDRLERERVRNELGGASSTDFLNAQVAFNSDRSILLNQELRVIIAREQLNVLLGRDPTTEIQVSSEFTIPELGLSYPEVLERALDRNAVLKSAELGKKVADRGVQNARTSYMPRLNAYASYGYGDQTFSSNRGPSPGLEVGTQTTSTTVGLSLSLNLFNGRRDKIQLQNAKIEADNQALAWRDARNRLVGAVQETFTSFQQRIEVVALEEQNIDAARQNHELQQERHELGVANSLEFRDAQVSLAQAQIALITARYQARISRLELEQLIGALAVE